MMRRSVIHCLTLAVSLCGPFIGRAIADEGPLRIFAIGDIGDAGSTLDGTAKRLSEMTATTTEGDALLILGDSLYPHGLKIRNEGTRKKLDAVWSPNGLAAIQKRFGVARTLAVPGNHEYYKRLLFGGIPVGFSEEDDGFRSEAGRLGWTYAGGRVTTVLLTAPDGTRVAVILLDSAVTLVGSAARAQTIFSELKSQLVSTVGKADWRILAMHHPVKTRGEHGFDFGKTEGHDWFRRHSVAHKQDACSDTYSGWLASLRSALHSVSEAPIDLAVSGHEHNLQMLDLGSAGANPRAQVVSGAASKTNLDRRRLGPGEFLAPRSGFAVIEATRETLRVRYVGSASNTVCLAGAKDSFTSFEMHHAGPVSGLETCASALGPGGSVTRP